MSLPTSWVPREEAASGWSRWGWANQSWPLRGGCQSYEQVQISSSSSPALELENKWEASGSWEEDWEAMVSKALQVFWKPHSSKTLTRIHHKSTTCQYYCRTTSLAIFFFVWMNEMPLSLSFGLWSPGRQMILPLGFKLENIQDLTRYLCRQKMLYASTKATFKKQFGAGQIKEDYYANHREEVSFSRPPILPSVFVLLGHSGWLQEVPCCGGAISEQSVLFFFPAIFGWSDLSMVLFNRLLLAPLVRQRRSRKPSKKLRPEPRCHQVCLNKKPFHFDGLVKVLFQVNVDTKHNTLSGLAFPLQQQATDSIKEYCQGGKDYVQLAIGRQLL